MAVDKKQAEKLAKDYMLAGDLKGWKYEFVEVNNRRGKGWWAAIFDIYSPEGDLFGGPVVVKIRESDGLVLTLDEAIEQGLLPDID